MHEYYAPNKKILKKTRLLKICGHFSVCTNKPYCDTPLDDTLVAGDALTLFFKTCEIPEPNV